MKNKLLNQINKVDLAKTKYSLSFGQGRFTALV